MSHSYENSWKTLYCFQKKNTFISVEPGAHATLPDIEEEGYKVRNIIKSHPNAHQMQTNVNQIERQRCWGALGVKRERFFLPLGCVRKRWRATVEQKQKKISLQRYTRACVTQFSACSVRDGARNRSSQTNEREKKKGQTCGKTTVAHAENLDTFTARKAAGEERW